MDWRVMGAAALAATALAGCETGPPMTPAQCQVADWAQVGFQDGSQGRPPERFVALEQACAAAGLPADGRAYMAGRQQGLVEFCQPSRAFRLGLSGGGYAGVCPPEFDNLFRLAYSDGQRANEALSALRSAESAISSLRGERDELERKIEANELGLIRSQTDAERERHRNELYRLRSDRDDVTRRLNDAEYDQRWRSREVSRLRSDIGFRYGDW